MFGLSNISLLFAKVRGVIFSLSLVSLAVLIDNASAYIFCRSAKREIFQKNRLHECMWQSQVRVNLWQMKDPSIWMVFGRWLLCVGVVKASEILLHFHHISPWVLTLIGDSPNDMRQTHAASRGCIHTCHQASLWLLNCTLRQILTLLTGMGVRLNGKRGGDCTTRQRNIVSRDLMNAIFKVVVSTRHSAAKRACESCCMGQVTQS